MWGIVLTCGFIQHVAECSSSIDHEHRLGCYSGPDARRNMLKEAAPICLLLGLVACQPAVDSQPIAAAPQAVEGDLARGLDVADRNCSLCHAVTPKGESPHPRAPTFRSLSARYPLDALSEALAEGIVVGHKGMPQIQLEPQQIRDLIAYMESIQSPATAKPK
jgi:mono/diheme cytochrome c family protein